MAARRRNGKLQDKLLGPITPQDAGRSTGPSSGPTPAERRRGNRSATRPRPRARAPCQPRTGQAHPARGLHVRAPRHPVDRRHRPAPRRPGPDGHLHLGDAGRGLAAPAPVPQLRPCLRRVSGPLAARQRPADGADLGPLGPGPVRGRGALRPGLDHHRLPHGHRGHRGRVGQQPLAAVAPVPVVRLHPAAARGGGVRHLRPRRHGGHGRVGGRLLGAIADPGPLLQHRVLRRPARPPGTGGPRRRPGPGQPPGGGRQPGQERVPGQHEPRDPHAPERHHRHDGPAGGHGAVRRAAGVRARRAPVGPGPAARDQRDPRLLQDRGRPHGRRADGLRPARDPGPGRAHPASGRRGPPQPPGPGHRARRAPPRDLRPPPPVAGAQQPGGQRRQVHHQRPRGRGRDRRTHRQRHHPAEHCGQRHRPRHRRRSSRRSSSSPSSRPTAPPPGASAARAWGCPSHGA